jgi:hypothetical protein
VTQLSGSAALEEVIDAVPKVIAEYIRDFQIVAFALYL